MSVRYLIREILIIMWVFFTCVLSDVVAAKRKEPPLDYNAKRSEMQPKELPRKLLVDLLQKGRYFQDIFSEHLAPLKIEFGHVCENPQEWEQRFERKDIENNQYQGKVRWGNKNGEYGEHYWDLNHGVA